mgnify:CR=1 FL=1
MTIDRELIGQLDENITVLRESWIPLRRRAHYIARLKLDADDLLASAVASAWEKWVAGTGPSTNIVAYLTQSMRNQAIDEQRSPRAGEVPLDGPVTEPAYIDDFSHIDHHVENTQLRAALLRLPESLRRVLVDVVVDGRKPRELEEEYGMTAPAISTAAYRAKKLLRAELFLEIIHGYCGDAQCAAAQERVAQDLSRSATVDDLSVRVSDLWRCCQCAAGLRHYISMSDRRAA